MDKNKLSFKILAILLTIFILAGCAGANAGNDTVGATSAVSSVTVTDTIETSGNLSAYKLATLKWNTSGVVEKVNVQAGDKVKRNQVLASLRLDSLDYSSFITASSDLATDQRALQALLASSTSMTQAQLDVLAAQKAVETATNTWDGMAYPRASDNLIKNTQAKIWEARDKLAIASKAYLQVQSRPEGDSIKAAALLAMTNAQTTLNNLTELYNWYTGKPSQADYELAKAKLDAARAALEDAKRKRDDVKSGVDPLEIAAAKAKVVADQARINTKNIVAPFDGEVLSVQAGEGNAVDLADPAVELVDRTTLKVETLVDESNISSVKKDDAAKITMDSLPDLVLTGKVAGISRIGSTVNGLVKYTVVISVDPTDKPVLFGATVNVAITTGAPHAMLAVPLSAIGAGSSSEYVILVGADGSTKRVDVKSGDLVGKLVTITTSGDIKTGDQVQLGIATSSGSGSGGGGQFFQSGPGPGG